MCRMLNIVFFFINSSTFNLFLNLKQCCHGSLVNRSWPLGVDREIAKFIYFFIKWVGFTLYAFDAKFFYILYFNDTFTYWVAWIALKLITKVQFTYFGTNVEYKVKFLIVIFIFILSYLWKIHFKAKFA